MGNYLFTEQDLAKGKEASAQLGAYDNLKFGFEAGSKWRVTGIQGKVNAITKKTWHYATIENVVTGKVENLGLSTIYPHMVAGKNLTASFHSTENPADAQGRVSFASVVVGKQYTEADGTVGAWETVANSAPASGATMPSEADMRAKLVAAGKDADDVAAYDAVKLKEKYLALAK